MKRFSGYKRLALLIIMAAAMIASVGCGPEGVAFGADYQGQNTDEQEAGSPDANETEDANDSDDGAQGDEGEVQGVVDSVSGNTVVIDGQTYTVPDDLLDELAALAPGSTVTVEFSVDTAGNLVVTDLEANEDGTANDSDDGAVDDTDDGDTEDVDEGDSEDVDDGDVDDTDDGDVDDSDDGASEDGDNGSPDVSGDGL